MPGKEDHLKDYLNRLRDTYRNHESPTVLLGNTEVVIMGKKYKQHIWQENYPTYHLVVFELVQVVTLFGEGIDPLVRVLPMVW